MKGLLFALGLLFAVQGPAGCTNEDDNQEEFELDPLDRGPYFDVSASRNVTALVGNTAVLNCRVRHLSDQTHTMSQNRQAVVQRAFDKMDKDKDGVITIEDISSVYDTTQHHLYQSGQEIKEGVLAKYLNNFEVGGTVDGIVSWVRHRDIHLLTVGTDTYTSDARFVTLHYPRTEDWTLQVKFSQPRDSGTYECQVSTTPPIGHSMHLSVVEPVTTVVGGPEMYINRGSTMNLTCVVHHSPEPPPAIYWTHNEEEINYDSPRGGVSVITEKGEITTSYLLVQRAQPADSGHYTCHPSNANWKTVQVHVLNGEHPAAMQHGGQLRLGNPPFVILLASLLAFLNHRH